MLSLIRIQCNMDRRIERKIQHKRLLIDSAFRPDTQSTSNYEVFFDSYDQQRAKRIKDVVAIQITNVSLPKSNDTILPGLNIFNLHVSIPQSNYKRISNEQQFFDYVTNLSSDLKVTTEVVTHKNSRWGAQNTTQRIYKISSPQHRLLSSPSYFSDSTNIDSEFYLLVTNVPSIWNVQFPLDLDLSTAESHRLLMKPGCFPTSSLVIQEFVETLTSVNSSIEGDFQYFFDSNPVSDEPQNGWSVFKDPSGTWQLFFRSNKTNMNILISGDQQHTHFDVLSQLGLRTPQLNWALPETTPGARNQVFKMKKHSIQLPLTSNTIGDSENVTTFYELSFDPITLYPRRYVDIVLENIPSSSLVTNSNIHRNVFARVHLTNHTVSYTTTFNNFANTTSSFDKASSSDAFVTFTNTTCTNEIVFDPISIDHLKIQLVDNLGRFYNSDRNHIMELNIVVLGDALHSFDFPVSDFGTVLPPRKKFDTLERVLEQPKKKHKKTNVKNIPVYPVQNWIFSHTKEVGISIFTFLFIFFAIKKVRSRNKS